MRRDAFVSQVDPRVFGLLLAVSSVVSSPLAQVPDSDPEPEPASGQFISPGGYTFDPSLPSPVTPSAAAIAKFGEVPVSLYSGLVSVDVPLFTAQGNGVTVPIALRYHGSGVRANERASWVGLGWALSAGGSITRSVRGTPDEKGPNMTPIHAPYGCGYHHAGKDLSVNKFWNSPGDNQVLDTYWYWEGIQNKSYKLCDGETMPFDEVYKRDYEPDMYYVSVEGHSASFVLPAASVDAAPTVQTDPRSPLRIEPHYSSDPDKRYAIDSWTVTGPSGTIYRFEEYSWTDKVISLTSPPQGVTDRDIRHTWHLTEIESPSGEAATLHYREVVRWATSASASQGVMLNSTGQYDFGRQRSITVSRQREHLLLRIETSQHSVYFDTSGRLDDPRVQQLEHTSDSDPGDGVVITPQGLRLDAIRIQSKPSGSEVRRFNFTHTYFNECVQAQLDNLTCRADQADLWKRLRLDAVTEVGVSEEFPSYQFDYKENVASYGGVAVTLPPYEPYRSAECISSDLPECLYLAVDHWGYFNGAWGNGPYGIPDHTSSSDPIWGGVTQNCGGYCPGNAPSVAYTDRFQVVSEQLMTDSDRDPNPTTMVGGALWSVTYPTGGRTEFEYGPHRYAYVSEDPVPVLQGVGGERTAGGLRTEAVRTYPGGNSPPSMKRYVYQEEGSFPRASGSLVSRPNYKGPVVGFSWGTPDGEIYLDTAPTYAADSYVPLTQTKGGYVGYGRVVEELGYEDGGTFVRTGWTAREFSSPQDEPDGYVRSGYWINPGTWLSVGDPGDGVPDTTSTGSDGGREGLAKLRSVDGPTEWWPGHRTSRDAWRGLLLSEEVFAEDGRLLVRTTNKYGGACGSDTDALAVRAMTFSRGILAYTIAWVAYEHRSPFVPLCKQTTERFE